jgi:hypothetical protein
MSLEIRSGRFLGRSQSARFELGRNKTRSDRARMEMLSTIWEMMFLGYASDVH